MMILLLSLAIFLSSWFSFTWHTSCDGYLYIYLRVYLLGLVQVFYLCLESVFVHSLLALLRGVCSSCNILLFLMLANDRHDRRSLQVSGDPTLVSVQQLVPESLCMFINGCECACQCCIFVYGNSNQRIVIQQTISPFNLISYYIIYMYIHIYINIHMHIICIEVLDIILANILFPFTYSQAHMRIQLLFYLALVTSSTYLASESGRAYMQPDQNSTMLTYRVPLQTVAYDCPNPAVMLSLNSFSYNDGDTATMAKLLNASSSYFTYNATPNVYQVSYIVVSCNQLAQVQTITVLFAKPGILSVPSQLITSHVPVQYSLQVIRDFGTVQPFISGMFYAPGVKFNNSLIQLGFEWGTSTIRIRRSPHIVKLMISYIAYIKLGAVYSSIQPYEPATVFNYRDSSATVFVGIRSTNITNRLNRTQTFVMYSALWARAVGIDPQLYIIADNSTLCDGFIDALNYHLGQAVCVDECNQSISNIYGFRVCSRHSYQLSEGVRYHNGNPMQDTTHYTKNDSQCKVYVEGNQDKHHTIYCKQCNSDNNYIKYYDGSCVCKPGYYAKTQQSDDAPQCYRCMTDFDCPFVIDATMSVLKTQANSSEYIEVHLTINYDYPNAYPLYSSQYSSVNLEVLVNDSKPSTTVQWIQPNSVIIQLRHYKFSNIYKVTINTKNSIFMGNQQQNIFLTPHTSRQLYYHRPEATKFISQSMGTISSFAPTAALISAVIGSKVNIFSFVQASSILYLSSYIKWDNFGSIQRVSLSQNMFKLTPTNLFASFNAHIPIPLTHSDDTSPGSNKVLSNFDNLLYASIVPQYLISSIIQVLAIELMIRILIKVFPHPTQILGHKTVKAHSIIKWHKKPFLIALIDSKQMQLRQYVSEIIQKVRTKRFIFYTTMMNSQLAFHSFMIFSQFTINVSTNQQIFNLFFSLFLLSLVIAIPCIGPHSPMVLLKSIGIVYKKRMYRVVRLWVFYVLGIAEVVVYGASIALFEFSLHQCGGIVVIIVVKMVLMWGYMKRIQFAKHTFLFLYFMILGFGTYSSLEDKKSMEIVAIILMFAVCGIEILKIIRSIIVALLGLLKQPASIKGLAIANRIVQRRNQLQL